MNKLCFFTVADQNNLKYADKMINSFRKFHPEAELILYGPKEIEKWASKDPQFFYRATPIIASELFEKGYTAVCKLDADQIIMGDLNHIIDSDGYDVGTVLNFNRTDYKTFGPITTYIIDCTRYYNNGLVMMRNPAFVEHWKSLCFTDEIFNNLQYREQDILNILCYFGNYRVRCFDYPDPLTGEVTWNGLVCKGEGLRMVLKNGKVILPKSEDGYPTQDTVIKAFHWAGPNIEKFSYRTQFPEEIIKHFDWLISDEKGKKA